VAAAAAAASSVSRGGEDMILFLLRDIGFGVNSTINGCPHHHVS
jgi:hypothetical protein